MRRTVLIVFIVAALTGIALVPACGGAARQREYDMSAAFLAANRAKPGVVVTPSGLQYRIITAGTGRKPYASDQVTVHYRGTLTNGKEFDSSIARNEPATFPVGGVIAGWIEALQMMPEGSKWELVIPSNLAYGSRGAGGVNPPHATHNIEVELLKIR